MLYFTSQAIIVGPNCQQRWAIFTSMHYQSDKDAIVLEVYGAAFYTQPRNGTAHHAGCADAAQAQLISH